MKRFVFRLVILVTLPALFVPAAILATGQSYGTELALAAEGGDIFINEVMFAPAPSGYEWVELKNGGSSPVRLSGYGLTDEDGHLYRVPATLPDVPVGASSS